MRGDDASLEPKVRLRSRVTLFFLLAATPAILLSAGSVVILDRFIAQEIESRTRGTVDEVRRILDDEARRVARSIEGLARSEETRRLVDVIDEPDLRRFEGLAPGRAAAEELDLLAVVGAREPNADVILSSAHLPASIDYPGPPFLAALPRNQTAVGFMHEYVEGNPPVLAPAIVAARAVESRGSPALFLYGGARLDGHRLRDIARLANATLVLRSPGLAPHVFFPDERQTKAPSTRPRAIPLPHLFSPGGASEKEEAALVEVLVDNARLEHARLAFLGLAAALVLASLLAAIVASKWLSKRITRPILALSHAAREIGAGNLDLEIEPSSRDEVGVLVRVFNQMTKELSESRARLAYAERVAAWREIARRVAHEIKNPLFPIQMSIETLRKSYKKKHEKLDEIFEESTRTVLEEVRSLNRIVAEFSDFARLPAPKRTDLDVMSLLEHVHSLYGAEPRANARVVWDREAALGRGIPLIQGDREQLGRALINLVKNALEALPESGGSVRLDAVPASRGGRAGVSISIADDGRGIPAGVVSSIFTPYFTTKAEGTGLGLAIVERIVSEHGGTVEVESKEGSGTTFSIWLPQGARSATPVPGPGPET